MRALALISVLTACADVPMPSNEIIDPPPGAEQAVSAAITAWENILDTDLKSPLVLWFDGPCLEYDNAYYQDHCVWGVAFSQYGEIHLSTSAGPYTIAHEMLHWALYEMLGDGNATHDAFEWSLVADARALMD